PELETRARGEQIRYLAPLSLVEVIAVGSLEIFDGSARAQEGELGLVRFDRGFEPGDVGGGLVGAVGAAAGDVVGGLVGAVGAVVGNGVGALAGDLVGA